MPWYSPWSDHIAKSVCKYLLQRYLGQFLEEKLTLDQLTVDLYEGIGVIMDVALDVQALNEVAKQQSIPFEFTDGFIEKMSVSVPWSSILTDATNIQVEGLSLIIKRTERDKSRVSMFESMWSSMTSSMQLAEDCLKNERDNADENSSHTFEGIESFAHTIDSILSRIKVKFFKTVIRLEEVPGNSLFGVAFEINIKLMEYFDEAVSETADNVKQDFHLSTFSTKKIYLEGVALFSDEFPACSTDANINFHNESNTLGEEKLSENTNILVGLFCGRQEVTMRFKQEGIEGPKVDLQITLGALSIFLSPRQIHNLFTLINGMTSQTARIEVKSRCVQKPMEESDFRKIEQELQMNLNSTSSSQPKGLINQGWANTCLETSEDEFSPMNNSFRLNESVLSSNMSLSSSVMTSSSRSSHSYAQTPFLQSKRKPNSGNVKADSSAIVFHFHVLLSSMSVVLLHDDILTMSIDTHQYAIAKSSFEQMKRLANNFFDELGHLMASGYGNKDFEKTKEIFLKICGLNHIRFVAAPIIVEGNETSTTHMSVINGKCTASTVEVLECLLEKDNHSQKHNVEYVELLKFKNTCTDGKESSHSNFLLPSVALSFRLVQQNSPVEKGRRYIQPKSDFSFEFQPFDTEIDITILDRISALLNPEFFSKNKSNIKSASPVINPHTTEHFQQVVENHSVPHNKQNVKIQCSLITFKVRFPIPDLRPVHDMDKPPWWKRSVRKDIIYLDVTDLTLNTVIDNLETVSKYETQFRDVIVKFKEADADGVVEFAKASADPNFETLTDEDRGFGWPRLVIQIFPKTNPSNLEEGEHFKLGSHNVDYQSLVSTLESTAKKEHSPFSCKKVIHESDTPHFKTSCPEQDGEELIIPGDKAEIADFVDVASSNARIKVDISLPSASVSLSSKHLYEVIYNRISSDLLLWESTAPMRDKHSRNADFNFQGSVNDFFPSFSLCKSAVNYESDSDTESQDGVFYSVYEQKQIYKKKQLMENNNPIGQSKIVFHVTITQGICDLYAPVRDSQGNVIPRQHGELHVSFDEGNLFAVSGYKGKNDLDYFCVQINNFSFYHNGLVSDDSEKPVLRTVGCTLPSYLEPTVRKTSKCALIDQSTSVGIGPTSLDMLTVSVRLQKHQLSQGLKMFRVAIGVREATLQHKVCNGPCSWFTQLVDFFDVTDYPIEGYEPSSVLSEVNLHLWNCSVDYRPLYLPLRAFLTVGNFNISSNIAAQTSSSTLRFIAEDSAFFISDKADVRHVNSSANLRKEYICVLELGLFELSVRLSEKNHANPKVDLRASANVAHVRTCSDSAKALTELLLYFASDGDLTCNGSGKGDPEYSDTSRPEMEEHQVLVKTGDVENSHNLSKSQVALVNDLMEEAMMESKPTETNCRKSKEEPVKTVYFEKAESEISNGEEEPYNLGSGLNSEIVGSDIDDKDDSWEKDFFIVQNEAGMGMMPKKGLPEVRNLTNVPVRLVDNHFSIPLGKADLLRSPKHYPKPVLRYMLREMYLIWHMYGGSDFEKDPKTSAKRCRINPNSGDDSNFGTVPKLGTVITYNKNSASGVNFSSKNENTVPWKQKGGPGRRHDVLMELQLNKVRFQHEVYPENTTEASRQVLLIHEVELRDRLATSTINKFLYQYSSEAKPKQSQAPMVVIKSVLMRSDPKNNTQECCLKVSLLPLRLNIDQDSILFLYQFFTELSGDNKYEEDESNSRTQTPKHQIPVMTVNLAAKSNCAKPEPQHLLIDLDEENQKKINSTSEKKRTSYVPPNKTPSQPVFFRCFIFSPEVPVKLDYQGKRVDMSHGSLAGILMGLGQLNNSELKLRKISYRRGLLGFDKLMNFVLSEWANDIKKNQLPSLLGGVGPMHSLVQLIQGIRDLFWLPIEQYQKDGRLVRGFQRGANSFTTSTAMASLELISRLIQIIQTTAETAYDMVSPGPSVRIRRRDAKGKPKCYSQPADIREGMAFAYLVVKEGIGETAETIVRVASEEHEQKGVTGAVGGVLRQIPPTVVKPIILTTEAANNLIGGMRSQLVPDARKEAVEKWRRQDS